MSRNTATLIRRRGRPVVLRRPVGGPTPFVTAVVKGLERTYGVHELVGNIQQGDHQVIVLAADLAAAGFPLPVRVGDVVVINPTLADGDWVKGSGDPLTVKDPGTRAGLGFWLQARG